MIVHGVQNQIPYKADFAQGHEIGISVSRHNGVTSFGIRNAQYVDYQDGDFIGNKTKGGPCNLETITFTPHGNSTHTECVGHISIGEEYQVNNCIPDHFYLSKLITVSSISDEDKKYLDFSKVDFNAMQSQALIIRSLPNDKNRVSKDYAGQNAPCIHPEDMKTIVRAGIKHLVIDLPSVDPEWDGGALLSHHIFWQYPDTPRLHCSITEFAYLEDAILDGDYLLKLNISPFESDAAPSRPVIYPIIAS